MVEDMNPAVRRELATHLGHLELSVLEALWGLGGGSVRQVLQTLQPQRDIAYTTVMTVLTRLADKGLLERKPQGRGFFYSPRYSPDALLQHLADEAVRRVLADFGDIAVARFLANVPDLSTEQVENLRRSGEAQ